MMASSFFDAFLFPANGRKTAWKDKRWPITVVVQREGEPLRQYSPRNDFLISNSALPRLLVQVNSTPKTQFPKDLRRMLATGAFIVRFANNFVSKFSQRKDFVLCTFFIAANGTATRYNLFQKLDGKKVYYTKKAFLFDDPLGRVEFARHLYNLRAELDQKEDQGAEDAVKALVDQVKKCKMKLMYTKSETGRGKHTESNHDDPAGGGGGNGHNAQLRAHGYELEPKFIMDDSGGTLEPVYKTPDHILTVYKRTNPNKMFIAKKVREESDELEILKFLDIMRPKSDHVISLVDSFGEWAIFPRMTTIEYYVDVSRKELQSKLPQVCLGLIEGVAYLHRLCIAHRDIKPDNLVVDKNFTLQIIDFDVAMRVQDEDEEVDDQCGTERWMAPEVKKKLWHSPIKADRWSCGLVLLFLLGVSSKEDISLKRFARSLMAHDPKERPSLLKWDKYLPPPFSDSDARETSQLRRDRVEGDGEMTKPNVKKQRH
ncbi:kinase-like domain-containing protein [Boletus edulis]|nr:kinase-like domain-containing protein [Boletus edulis]